MKTMYCVVKTEIYKTYENEVETYEEAKKILDELMKKDRKPNTTWQIVKYMYENCTPEEWNKK